MREILASTVAFSFLYALSGLPASWAEGLPSEPMLVASLFLAVMLAAASAIDLREYRLPDTLTLPLLAAGLLVSWWISISPLWWRAASAVIGFALLALLGLAYRYVRGRTGLGLGDAKLLAASGAWVGAEGLPTVLLWASGSAIVGVIFTHLRGGDLKPGTRIPFGPFIAFGTWIVWLYGPA